MLDDVEALAAWVYVATGYDTAAPPGPGYLLEALVGADHIRFSTRAALTLDAGGYWVTLPERLTDGHTAVVMAALMARIAAHKRGRALPDSELAAAAAAILMPRRALELAVYVVGADAGAIADAFAVPYEVAERRLRHAGHLARSGEFGAHDRRLAR